MLKKAVLGPPLAEVFLVNVNPNAEKCHVYGTVQVIDELGTLIIYDRSPEDSECNHQNGTLSLTSPNRTISASDSFHVDFDLKEKINGGIGVEFIKGSSHWDLSQNYDWYNKCIPKNVNGKQGSATLYATVLNSAVQATIHAQLFKLDRGNQRIEVFGSLVARYCDKYYYHCDDMDDENLMKNTRLVLFEAKEDKPAKLSFEEEKVDIPLSRSLVAVPTYSSLKFEVELSCVSSNGDHCEVVKNSEVEFPAEWYGKSNVDIEGKYGSVRLSVSWRTNYRDYYGAPWDSEGTTSEEKTNS